MPNKLTLFSHLMSVSLNLKVSIVSKVFFPIHMARNLSGLAFMEFSSSQEIRLGLSDSKTDFKKLKS